MGKALLMRLVDIARERGYGRVEWSVLDWNEPAIGFYRALGATPNDEWTVWRLIPDRRPLMGHPGVAQAAPAAFAASTAVLTSPSNGSP